MTPYDRARANLARALQRINDHLKAAPEPALPGYLSELRALTQDPTLTEQQVKDRIAAAIILWALWAFEDGLEAGGIDKSQVDAADEAVIGKWQDEQTAYAASLAAAIVANSAVQLDLTKTAEEKAQSLSVINDRLQMWGESLGSLTVSGRMAAIAKGGDDPLITWWYNDGNEHCHTCADLNGKTEKLSWFVLNGYIPRQPGSETLDCHGYRCACHCEDKNGNWVM